MGRVTIYHIAEAAGVSPSTVSRALSRPGRVSNETAQKVYEAAQALGYHAEQVAPVRAGAGAGGKKLLALVVADVTNPVSAALMRSAQLEAETQNASLLLIETQENDERERRVISEILNLVDGLVLASSRISDSAILQIAKIKPVVVINRVVRGVPSLVPDTDAAMKTLTEYALSRGYQQLHYLAGPAFSWADGARWRSLQRHCDQLCLSRLGPFKPSLVGGVEAANQVLKKFDLTNPAQRHLFVAYNDYMAIGFLKTLQRQQLLVPQSAGIIGIDNSVSCLLTTPTLTSLGASPREISARAIQILGNWIEHPRANPPAQSHFAVELVEREST